MQAGSNDAQHLDVTLVAYVKGHKKVEGENSDSEVEKWVLTWWRHSMPETSECSAVNYTGTVTQLAQQDKSASKPGSTRPDPNQPGSPKPNDSKPKAAGRDLLNLVITRLEPIKPDYRGADVGQLKGLFKERGLALGGNKKQTLEWYRGKLVRDGAKATTYKEYKFSDLKNELRGRGKDSTKITKKLQAIKRLEEDDKGLSMRSRKAHQPKEKPKPPKDKPDKSNKDSRCLSKERSTKLVNKEISKPRENEDTSPGEQAAVGLTKKIPGIKPPPPLLSDTGDDKPRPLKKSNEKPKRASESYDDGQEPKNPLTTRTRSPEDDGRKDTIPSKDRPLDVTSEKAPAALSATPTPAMSLPSTDATLTPPSSPSDPGSSLSSSPPLSPSEPDVGKFSRKEPCRPNWPPGPKSSGSDVSPSKRPHKLTLPKKLPTPQSKSDHDTRVRKSGLGSAVMGTSRGMTKRLRLADRGSTLRPRFGLVGVVRRSIYRANRRVRWWQDMLQKPRRRPAVATSWGEWVMEYLHM